jgi:hypothetical protein
VAKDTKSNPKADVRLFTGKGHGQIPGGVGSIPQLTVIDVSLMDELDGQLGKDSLGKMINFLSQNFFNLLEFCF